MSFIRKSSSILLVLLLVSALASGCFGKNYAPIEEFLPESINHEGREAHPAVDAYEIRVAFVHDAETGIAHESPLHHLSQSTLVQLKVEPLRAEAWISSVVGDSREGGLPHDLAVLDAGLAGLADAELHKLAEHVRTFASRGGTVFLPHEFAEVFPAGLLGMKETAPISSVSLDFAYPEAPFNLQGLQDVWAIFADTYAHYNGLNPEFHIHHEFGLIPEAATPLVELDGVAMMTVNRIGDGAVIWSNRFLPNQQFITRFDLVSEDAQKYFHFGYATANYLFHQELAAFVAKEKYGYALSKAYGPYGRPGLAWQNHYEEAYSYRLQDMIKWTDLLREHHQIPTFSLVRNSYNGGQWHTSIAWHENTGTDEAPSFAGESLLSHFTAGVRMETKEDYVFFDRYPGYNSLMSKLEEAHRAYIDVVDWDGDGRWDLLSGDVEGQVWLLRQRPDSAGHQFETPVKVVKVHAGGFAAPAVFDVNGDGLWDIVAGNGDGRLFLFLNTGTASNPKFDGGQVLKSADGSTIQVPGPAAPRFADWDGDGLADLLVGDGEGFVHLFTGAQASGGLAWTDTGKLTADGAEVKVAAYAAPFATDWNEDGRPDLLVGSSEGTIRLYLGTAENGLADAGVLEGQYYNFYGDRKFIPGKNTVPVAVDWNGDGNKDLLTGHLEYAIPRPIDSELFPHREYVIKNLTYVKERHIPLIPHMFLSTDFTDEQEKREIALHKAAFHHFGLAWDKDMGVNHHTWRINRDALSTFRNQAASGIWWNFGFNPPNVSTAPRDGVEFLLVVPFDVSRQADMRGVDGEPVPFVLFSPAPNILNYPNAWDALARFQMPLTYFEHIEHGMKEGTDIYNRHLTKIGRMNEFREKYHYTFMTEEQMARSLLTTFYGEVAVTVGTDGLILTPDMSRVPWQAREYAQTLGIRIEPGERYKDLVLDTDSLFYHKDGSAYYVGVDKETSIRFGPSTSVEERIYIAKTNAPVHIRTLDNGLEVTLDTYGMQEITFHSPVPLEFSKAGLDVLSTENHTYTVIHYGEPVTFTVRAIQR